MRHHWTEEDDRYLSDNWGTVSIIRMAKKINCSIGAVQRRAGKLKLGSYVKASDLITITDLATALLGKNIHDQSTQIRNRWVKLGLPVHKRKINKRVLLMINIEEFWEWLGKNRSAINLSKLERGTLGKEPDWVDEKRKSDSIAPQKKHCAWKKSDDDILKLMILNNESLDAISKRLERSAAAINSRVFELRLKLRPERQDKKFWTEEEDRILEKVMSSGQGYFKAAMLLNRSQESCHGRCKRLWDTTNQLKLQKMLNKNLK